MSTITPEPETLVLERFAVEPTDSDRVFPTYCERLSQGVVRATPRVLHTLAPENRGQFERLVQWFDALPVEDRHEIIASPYFHYWWLNVKEIISGERTGDLDHWVHHLPRFLLVQAAGAGLWAGEPLIVATDTAELRLPHTNRHVLLPEAARTTRSVVTLDGDRLTVAVGDAAVTAPLAALDPTGPDHPAVSARAVVPGTRVEIDAGDPFVHRLFASINGKPPAEGYGPPELAPMSVQQPIPRQFAAAMDLIERSWPELHREILIYTRVIVPFTSPQVSTFTEAAFMGAVFMGEVREPFSSVVLTAEHLLHEATHLRYTLVCELDELFSPGGDGLVDSPWRRDPRPVERVLSASVVFGRIAEFLRRVSDPELEAVARERRRHVLGDLDKAMTVLDEPGAFAGLTDNGRSLLADIRSELDQWSGS